MPMQHGSQEGREQEAGAYHVASLVQQGTPVQLLLHREGRLRDVGGLATIDGAKALVVTKKDARCTAAIRVSAAALACAAAYMCPWLYVTFPRLGLSLNVMVAGALVAGVRDGGDWVVPTRRMIQGSAINWTSPSWQVWIDEAGAVIALQPPLEELGDEL